MKTVPRERKLDIQKVMGEKRVEMEAEVARTTQCAKWNFAVLTADRLAIRNDLIQPWPLRNASPGMVFKQTRILR